MRARLLALGLGLFLAVLPILPGAAQDGAGSLPQPLRSPVDVAAQRAAAGDPLDDFACSGAPAPPPDLVFQPFFRDQRGTQRDEALYAAYAARREPLDQFKQGLARLASRNLRAAPGHDAAGTCGAAWLLDWARAGALVDVAATQQGEFERMWLLAAVASSYARLQAGERLAYVDRLKVKAWIRALARHVIVYFGPGGGYDWPNNLVYWAGFAVAAAAVAVDEPAWLAFSTRQFRRGVAQVDARGLLPLEMRRGPRALYYGSYALVALVGIMEIGEANGLDLAREAGPTLARAGSALAAVERDASAFEAEFGPQAVRLRDACWTLTWVEPLEARFPSPDLSWMLKACRPISLSELGGVQTGLGFAAALRGPLDAGEAPEPEALRRLFRDLVGGQR
ncbi:alginate lyase family protein [Zavarzinia sp. CC-PAN008]|uniref:alginate lyase family protein n=1 Tax=Zavarzinia sp. CC-PAN008 TaxID=3243332 RepID=UPI003F7496F0